MPADNVTISAEFKKVDYTEIQKSMNLVIGSTVSENAALMIGYYKGGVLLKLDIDTVNGDFTHALLDIEDADEIKVFLWKGINSLEPVCPAQREIFISNSLANEYIHR